MGAGQRELEPNLRLWCWCLCLAALLSIAGRPTQCTRCVSPHCIGWLHNAQSNHMGPIASGTIVGESVGSLVVCKLHGQSYSKAMLSMSLFARLHVASRIVLQYTVRWTTEIAFSPTPHFLCVAGQRPWSGVEQSQESFWPSFKFMEHIMDFCYG